MYRVLRICHSICTEIMVWCHIYQNTNTILSFCGVIKVKSYVLFVTNLLPLYLVCKKCISIQNTQLRSCACQFQINVGNWFHCFRDLMFLLVLQHYSICGQILNIFQSSYILQCILVSLELVITVASRALTRTLFMVDLLSAVKCLLLYLKTRRKSSSQRRK